MLTCFPRLLCRWRRRKSLKCQRHMKSTACPLYCCSRCCICDCCCAIPNKSNRLSLQGGSVVERLTGADVPGFSGKVAALAGPRPAGAAPVEDLNTRLQGLVSKSDVVLFMCASQLGAKKLMIAFSETDLHIGRAFCTGQER